VFREHPLANTILDAVFENLVENMGSSLSGKCIAENVTISAKEFSLSELEENKPWCLEECSK
jgi:hypothetical protein